MTLMKMENAHMIVYYIGNPKGNRFGHTANIYRGVQGIYRDL